MALVGAGWASYFCREVMQARKKLVGWEKCSGGEKNGRSHGEALARTERRSAQ